MTAIVDVFPQLRSKKWMVSGVLCIVLYIAGFSMCTKVLRVGPRVPRYDEWGRVC